MTSGRFARVARPLTPTAPQGADVISGKDPTIHTEIQWDLLKLGNDMGLDVWVARNDRGRDWNGHKFADLPRLRTELPRQFDEATNRTIELIDVLWLNGNAIVAAFEIEKHHINLFRSSADVRPRRDAAQSQHSALPRSAR